MAEDLVNRYNHETKLWERVPRTSEHTPGAIAEGTILPPLLADPSKIGHSEGVNVPAYKGGSVRSVQMLNMLRFDPIEQLVKQYRKLEEELAWHEQLRSGSLVPLRPSGKPHTYNAEHHLRVFERLEAISAQLLRYGYGRVSETLDLNVNRPNKLVFNLSKKGETFVINDNNENENGD